MSRASEAEARRKIAELQRRVRDREAAELAADGRRAEKARQEAAAKAAKLLKAQQEAATRLKAQQEAAQAALKRENAARKERAAQQRIANKKAGGWW